MSKTNQFWQYAKEATLSAIRAKTKEERQALFDLARTWTQAALIERHAQVNDGSAALHMGESPVVPLTKWSARPS